MALKRMKRAKTSHDEIVASALIDLNDEVDVKYLRSAVTNSKFLTKNSWDWYKLIGEVHYAVSRSAKIAGYARLGAYRLGPDGKPAERIDTGVIADKVSQIYSPYGGVRGLIQRFYTLMKIPGDSFLIRVRSDDGEPDGYMFLSADELDTSSLASPHMMGRNATPGGLKWITLPATAGFGSPSQDRFVVDVSADDFIGRVWAPSHQYVDLPDSPMLGLDTECEVLHELTETLKAKIRSRFAMAGLLFLPNEISNINIAGPSPDPTGVSDDKVLNWLVQAMTRNVKSRSDAAAWLPILLRGPGEAADKIKHILLDTEIFEVDIKLRDELIKRILMGLDVQQNAVSGIGDSNHWAAWAVSDEERRISVQPDLESMCWALTRLVLHPLLLEEGMDAEEIATTIVWYDISDASVRSNQQEDARQLHDRFAISDEKLRKVAGMSDADQPSEEEYVRMVGRKINDPYLALFGLGMDVDWQMVGLGKQRSGPLPSAIESGPAGPGVGQPGAPDGGDSDVPRSQRPG